MSTIKQSWFDRLLNGTRHELISPHSSQAPQPPATGGPALADLKGKVDAILRSQAVIEFDLQGQILDANDNFLNALGYTLAEIKGQHHSMFATPEYRSSPEYRAFWDKLGRGEFDAGQYKRIAKGGREIWIQASYNPVFDANGKPVKVVKFATDITAAKQAEADMSGRLSAIDRAQAAIEFSLDGRILNANDNFLGALGYTLAEIKGQHHSLFVDPAYRASVEYRMFWDKLGRGEFDAGQYKRIAKGGREIWIQATYNPIFDPDGKAYKVVKYATDVTEQVKAAQMLREAVEQSQGAMVAAEQGDLGRRIPMTWAASSARSPRATCRSGSSATTRVRSARSAETRTSPARPWRT